MDCEAPSINMFPINCVQWSINIICLELFRGNLGFLLLEGEGLPHNQKHQTVNLKLMFHQAPTPIKQMYVDIPSITG